MPRRNVIHDLQGQVLIPKETSLLFGRGIWTNMPAAITNVFGDITSILPVDLSGFEEYRPYAVVNTAGSAGAFLTLQQSPDANNVLFQDFDVTLAGNDQILIDSVAAILPGYVPIPPQHRDRTLFLRFVGTNGNGVADPQFAIWLFLR